MRHPTPFMFVSTVGFSGTADRTAPFPVGSSPRWRLAAILKNFGHIAAMRHPFDFVFGSRLGILAMTDDSALFQVS